MKRILGSLFIRLYQRSRWAPASFRILFLSIALALAPILGGATGDIKLVYAASSALTITLASLATSSTWVAGRESTAVDNSSNLYLDYLLAGKITVGTTPTANTEIRVYVVGMLDDSTYPDVFDGTDSDETWTNAQMRDSTAKLAAVIANGGTTSNVTFTFGPMSVAALFGGTCPRKFVVFVTHNTGVNLNSTGGNHAINITPVYANVA